MTSATFTFPDSETIWEIIRKTPKLNGFGINVELHGSVTYHAGEELPIEEAFKTINNAIIWLPKGQLERFIDNEMRQKQPQWLSVIAKAFVEALIEDAEMRKQAFDSLLEAFKTEGLDEEAAELRKLIKAESDMNFLLGLLAKKS